MLKPTRGRLVVTNVEEKKDKDSLIVSIETKASVPMSGIVLAVGDPVTARDKKITCNAQPGDTVYFQRWSGADMKKKLDANFKIFLKFDDIIAIKRVTC